MIAVVSSTMTNTQKHVSNRFDSRLNEQQAHMLNQRPLKSCTRFDPDATQGQLPNPIPHPPCRRI